MSAQERHDVLLCHAPADRERFTDRLFDALSALGQRVRYDRHDAASTDEFRQRLIAQLQQTRLAIVVVSRNFFSSCWPESQLPALFELEPALDVRLLPVVLDLSLRQRQVLEPLLSGRTRFSGLDGEALVAKRLSEAIETKTTRPIPRNVFGDLRKPSERFVDPGGQLETLAEALQHTSVRLVPAGDVVSGAGMRELAVQLAFGLGEESRLSEGRFPGGIYWLDAIDPQLGPQWERIARSRGLDDDWPASRVQGLVARIGQTSQRTLIVVDNVEDWSAEGRPQPLAQGAHVRVLLIPRKTDIAGCEFAPHPLQSLSAAGARELLAATSRRECASNLDALAALLGGDGLSLELCGHYLGRFPDVAIDDFVRLLRKGGEHTDRDPSPNADVVERVLTCIWALLDAAEREAFLVAACFEDSSATAALASACGLSPGPRARLARWGLLQTVGDDQWTTHPRVRRFGRRAGTQTARARAEELFVSGCNNQAWAQLVFMLVRGEAAAAESVVFHLHPRDRPQHARAAQLAARAPNAKTWRGREDIAVMLGGVSQHRAALDLLELAVPAAVQERGRDQVYFPLLRLVEACALRGLGQLELAKAVLGQALGLVQSRPHDDGLSAPYLLHCGLGLVCLDLGDPQAARAHYEDALAMAKRRSSRGSTSVSGVAMRLVEQMQEVGDFEGARALLEQALAAEVRGWGEQNKFVGEIRRKLCDVLRRLRDFDAAKQLLQSALASSTQALGLQHTHTSGLMAQLGAVLHEAGEFRAAATHFDRALQLELRHRGDVHAIVVGLHASLGASLHALGELPRAQHHLELALAAQRSLRGTDAPEVAAVAAQLAAVLHERRDLERAHELLERAIASRRSHAGEATAGLLDLLQRNAAVLRDLGKLAEAQANLRPAARQLERFEPQFARVWLEAVAGRVDLGDTRGLLERLDGHCLSLQLAGRYLGRTPDRGASDLVERLQPDPPGETVPTSVVERMLDVVWPVLDSHLQQACLLAACFADAPVSAALAEACGLHESLRRELDAWGLLTVQDDSSWALPRPVRVGIARLRGEATDSELEHRFHNGCAQRTRHVDDWLGARDYSVDRRHHEAVAQTILTAPGSLPRDFDSAGFLGRIAVAEKCAGQPAAARQRMQSALEVASAVHGADQPAVAKYLHGLADILIELGEYEAARSLLERALESNLKGQKDTQPEIVMCRGRLGLTFHRLGASERAQALLTQAIADGSAALGARHPRVLEWRIGLGSLLRGENDLEGAQRTLAQVLEATSSEVDHDHPLMLQCRGSLARVLHDSGRSEDAKQLLQQAHQAALVVLGVRHPLVATLAHDLGQVLWVLGERDGCLRALKRALEARTAVFGDDHPRLIEDCEALGSILHEIGDELQADTRLRQALTLAIKNHGAGHERVALLERRLATIRRELGDLAEAKRLLEQAVASARTALDERDPRRAQVHLDLIAVLQELGEHEGARSQVDEAARLVRLQPADAASRASAQQQIVSTLRSLGELARAKRLLQEELERATQFAGPEPTSVVALREQLEQVVADIAGRENAWNDFEAALQALRADSADALSPSAAQSKLAAALMSLQPWGELEAARKRLASSLEFEMAALGVNHPALTLLRASLGLALFGLGELEAAREELEATVYELDTLGSELARSWLEVSAGRRPLADADALLARLSGDALAIDLAGNYLRHHQDLAPNDYLRLLRRASRSKRPRECGPLEAALDVIWASLDVEARQAWSLSACFDAGAVSGERSKASGLASEQLQPLEQWRIVRVGAEGGWTMPACLRSYGRRAGTESARLQAMERFLAGCEEQTTLTAQAAHSRLELVSGRVPLTDADRLLAQLGGDGLAIELAGNYLRRYPDLSPSDYLRLLRKARHRPRVADGTSNEAHVADDVLDTLWTVLEPQTRAAWQLAAAFEDAPATTGAAEKRSLTVERRAALRDFRLLRDVSGGRWSMPHVVRRFGRQARRKGFHPKFDSNGQLTDQVYYDSTGAVSENPSGPSRVLYDYDAQGRLIHQSTYRHDGSAWRSQHGPAVTDHRYDASGQRVESILSGYDGSEGFTQVSMRYQADGWRRIRFLDDAGQPTRHEAGHFGYLEQLSEGGRFVRQKFLDADGQPCAIYGGIYGRWMRLTAQGKECEVAYLDAQGELTTGEGVCARKTRAYDERGREIENAYFGTDDRPTLGPSGAARETFVHAPDGRVLEVARFGVDGEPLALPTFGA